MKWTILTLTFMLLSSCTQTVEVPVDRPVYETRVDSVFVTDHDTIYVTNGVGVDMDSVILSGTYLYIYHGNISDAEWPYLVKAIQMVSLPKSFSDPYLSITVHSASGYTPRKQFYVGVEYVVKSGTRTHNQMHQYISSMIGVGTAYFDLIGCIRLEGGWK